MQLVSQTMVLISECCGREQRGVLPQRQLLETHFQWRAEVSRIFLWILKDPLILKSALTKRD